MKELRFIVIGLFAATALSFVALTALASGHSAVATYEISAGPESR